MAIKDDPATRLKAKDARTVFHAAERSGRLARLTELLHAHGLKAISCIWLDRGVSDAETRAHATADADVLQVYMRGWHTALAPIAGDLHGLILLGVRDDGVIDIATWGADARQCAQIAKLAHSHPLSTVPFQTWFGGGCGGRPKALTEAELGSLSTFQQGWAESYTHPRASRAPR